MVSVDNHLRQEIDFASFVGQHIQDGLLPTVVDDHFGSSLYL